MQPWIMIQTGMVTGWEDKMNIREELGKRMLFFDGGLGSLLQARGLKPGELGNVEFKQAGGAACNS